MLFLKIVVINASSPQFTPAQNGLYASGVDLAKAASNNVKFALPWLFIFEVAFDATTAESQSQSPYVPLKPWTILQV